MLNDEIGTYPIAQAIHIKPDIVVSIEGRHIKSIINGIEYIGNWEVVKEICSVSKLKKRKKLSNNKVVHERTPMEVLSDVYGISEEHEWEIFYNPDTVWETCVSLSNSSKEINKQNKFELDDNTGSL